MKKCNFCGEQIQDLARKCRHCGEWVENSSKEQNTSNSGEDNGDNFIRNDDPLPKYILFQIIRINLIWICLSLLMLWISYAGFQSIKNIYNGAIEITENDSLEKFKGIIVSFNSKTIDTGFTAVTQTLDKYSKQVKSETSDGKIIASRYGDNVILILSPTGQHDSSNYRGTIKPNTQLINDSIAKMETENPDLKGKFTSFYLDETQQEGWLIAIIIICITLFSLYKLVYAIIYLYKPKNHPFAKQLSIFQDYFHNLNLDIDSELKTKILKTYSNGLFTKTTISEGWIFQRTFLTFTFFPLDSTVWIYKGVTSHSVNFVPTGKSYSLTIRNFLKQSIVIELSEKKVYELMIYFMDLLPYIIFGHSKDLEQMYSKNIADFKQAVDRRKI